MAESPRQARKQNEKTEPRQLTANRSPDVRAPRNAAAQASAGPDATAARPVEHGGPAGLEPTRYGDWERAGRCIDF